MLLLGAHGHTTAKYTILQHSFVILANVNKIVKFKPTETIIALLEIP
jgi:hypothetical protein